MMRYLVTDWCQDRTAYPLRWISLTEVMQTEHELIRTNEISFFLLTNAILTGWKSMLREFLKMKKAPLKG